jgi:hypothetical protein
MPENAITLDDIYALFRESEQQRKEYQQDFEQRQQDFEQRQRTHENTYKREIADLRQIVAQTNKQVAGLSSRWGKFVENLVKPAAAQLFREQGIDVHHTALRVDAQDSQGSLEIDILVENTNEVVAIEVKSHLEVRDVKQFLQTLEPTFRRLTQGKR